MLKLQSFRRFGLFVVAFMSGGAVQAAGCVSESVASVENTSCTIGDVIFSFGAASIVDDRNTGKTLSDFTFTPIGGVVGFKITGSFANTFDITGAITTSNQYLALFDTFATISGLPSAASVTVTTFATVSGSALSVAEYSQTALTGNILLQNFADAKIGDFESACGEDVQTCTSAFIYGPVSATQGGGSAALGSVVQSGDFNGSHFSGSVTSTETDFIVNDGYVAAPIPEPSSYAMMLAGLGALGFVARRREA